MYSLNNELVSMLGKFLDNKGLEIFDEEEGNFSEFTTFASPDGFICKIEYIPGDIFGLFGDIEDTGHRVVSFSKDFIKGPRLPSSEFSDRENHLLSYVDDGSYYWKLDSEVKSEDDLIRRVHNYVLTNPFLDFKFKSSYEVNERIVPFEAKEVQRGDSLLRKLGLSSNQLSEVNYNFEGTINGNKHSLDVVLSPYHTLGLHVQVSSENYLDVINPFRSFLFGLWKETSKFKDCAECSQFVSEIPCESYNHLENTNPYRGVLPLPLVYS